MGKDMMKETYDVIVVGGGPGGLNAAIAAGRLGARTLLMERYGFLGGMSTIALVYPWMTFHDQVGNQVIRGIPQEIVDRLKDAGGSPGHLRDTIGVTYTVTPYDKEIYKNVAVEMATEAGVDLLFHSLAVEAAVEGPAISTVRTVGPYGSRELRGKTFVDGTGDCSLVAVAGGKTVKGRPQDSGVQPMTMVLRLGQVDLEAVKAYMVSHPEEFYHGSHIDKLDEWPLTGVSGFFSLWEEHGPSYIPRDLVLFFAGVRPDDVFVNTTRITEKNPDDVESVTEAEIEARRQTADMVRFFQGHVPGFADSYLLETGPQVGLREGRRLGGKYTLRTEDITKAAHFDDVIARNGYQIDIHDPSGDGIINLALEGGAYDIPYRSLVPQTLENVVVAGRAIDCSVEAFASLRTTPSSMAIGHAAGVAAALAAQNDCALAALDVDQIQSRLLKQGADLGDDLG